jgi:hypothetical protein
MQISKISNLNNSNFGHNEEKKKNVQKTATILTGSSLIGPAGFLVIDSFTNRKTYKQNLKNLKNNFNEKVERYVQERIDKVTGWGETVDQDQIDAYRRLGENKYNKKYFEDTNTLKKLRLTHLKKWLGITAGIGLSLGTAYLAIKNSKTKNDAPETKNINTQPTNPQTTNFVSHKPTFAGKISFTGIVDDYADVLSYSELEELKDYVNGKNPYYWETSEAKEIAKYRIARDWPKGLNEHNIYLYGIKNGYPIRTIPTTDREYQTILIDQRYPVPSRPPDYYRNYDKWFETDRYKEWLKWPEYKTKKERNERMQSLVAKERAISYAEEKAELERQAKRNIAAACFKYKLNREFLTDFNSNDPNVKVPNSIMLLGGTKSDRQEDLRWIVGKATNARYTYIEDKNDSNETLLTKIINELEVAQEYFQKNKKRTLLWVQNFDKLLVDTPENEDIVGDMKALLSELSSEYKTTIIFETDRDTKTLNPIALQDHRMKKFDIVKEATSEELRKLQNEYIRSHITKIVGSDGYRFNYKPFQDDYVDIYLGKFGYKSDVLWVQSQDAEAILSICDNIKVIKTIPRFKNVVKLQFPKPNQTKNFNSSKLIYTGDLTKEGQPIYEYRF